MKFLLSLALCLLMLPAFGQQSNYTPNIGLRAVTAPMPPVTYNTFFTNAVQSIGGAAGTNFVAYIDASTNTITISNADITVDNGVFTLAGHTNIGAAVDTFWTNTTAAAIVLDADVFILFGGLSTWADLINDGIYDYNSSFGDITSDWDAFLGSVPPTVHYFGTGPNALVANGAAVFNGGFAVNGAAVFNGSLTGNGNALSNLNVAALSNSLLSKVMWRSNSWIDVHRDFGAVGDQVHDDTANIQAALNYAFGGSGASNMTVYFPTPKLAYRLDGRLVIPAQNGSYGMHLRGDGRYVSRLIFTTSGVVGLLATNGQVQSITIEDLGFFGPRFFGGYSFADASIGLQLGGFLASPTYGVQIKDCLFQFWGTGLSISNSWNTRVVHSEFSFNPHTCISASGAHVVHIEDCTISGYQGDDSNVLNGDKGVWIKVNAGVGAGDDMLLVNNLISGLTNAIQNDGDSALNVVDCHMEANASYYTATNFAPNTLLQNLYILQQGFAIETQRVGAFNVNAENLRGLTIINMAFDGGTRPMIDVASDPNSIGYVPPTLIGNFNGSFRVRFLGDDKVVLPLLPRSTRMTSDSLVILSNQPTAWPVAPPFPGAADIVSSNGYIYLRVSTNGSGGVSAAFTGTNALVPLPSSTNFTVYAAGTAYTLTGSSAALDFGTTDPVLTINQAGTYLIQGYVGVKYNGATYVGAQTVTFKFRRTNNTATDLSNGGRAVELPVLTTFTGGDVMAVPPVVYTATPGDTITIFGILSATPSAGSVQTDSAEIVAVRLF